MGNFNWGDKIEKLSGLLDTADKAIAAITQSNHFDAATQPREGMNSIDEELDKSVERSIAFINAKNGQDRQQSDFPLSEEEFEGWIGKLVAKTPEGSSVNPL